MCTAVWSGVDFHNVHDQLTLGLTPGLVLLAFGYVLTLHDFFFLGMAWYFYFYMIGDIAWIALFPHSVRRVASLLAHHSLSLLFSVFPYLYQSMRWSAAVCLLVEINTWSLVGRRQWKAGFVHMVLNGLFLTTWFAIRCGIFPYMVYTYYLLWLDETKATTNPYNTLVLALILHVALVVMQIFWTWELIEKLREGAYFWTYPVVNTKKL